jgi:MFS family permease
VLRFLQGLGLGGEWGGAVVMTMENSASGRRGFDASWPQVGVPIGNLLAAGVLGLLGATLSPSAFLAWGWRIGFFLSGALVLIGLWVRLTVAESARYRSVRASGRKAPMPLVEVIKRHPRGLLVAMAARVGTDVAFYTFTAYLLVFITTNLGLSKTVGLDAVLVGSAAQLVLIPTFGALSDRFVRRPVYAAGASAAAAWAFAFFPLVATRATALIIAATVIALAAHAMMYGPQAAFIAELFATTLRYSGASMGYQVAGIFGGGIAPIVAIALVRAFHTPFAVSGYVPDMAVITLIALKAAPEIALRDLDELDEPRPARHHRMNPARGI